MLNKILKFFAVLSIILIIVIVLISLFTKNNSKNTYPSINPSITSGINNEIQDEQLQGKSDAAFSQHYVDFQEKYPWYKKIPHDSRFFIVFDSSKNLFYIELYPSKSSTISLSQQTQTLKNEVNSKLQSIGVNLSQYNFEWHIYPK